MKDEQPFGEWWAENGEHMLEKQRQQEQAEKSAMSTLLKVIKSVWTWAVVVLFLAWYLINGGAVAQFG